MRQIICASALAFAITLHAQEPAPVLAPELMPLATKYKADSAALNTQNEDAMARLAQVYSGALDTAEKTETTAGHVVAIAAITHERADLKKGGVDAEFPKDLPKGLQNARKTYLDGVARVAADFEQRQGRINADYLRGLATLLTRIGNNPAIAAQVAAEKEKALATPVTAATTEFEHQLLGTRWIWNITDQMTFQPSGKTDMVWRAVKPNTIKYSFPNGNHGTVEFDSGMTRGTISETCPDGKKGRYPLVRVKE